MQRDDLIRRARQYAGCNGLVLADCLGSGNHGSVFAAECQTAGGRSAVKAHLGQPAYRRERDVYLRLSEVGVKLIRGCHVPALIHYDDELWCIEMTVVSRPFMPDGRTVQCLEWAHELRAITDALRDIEDQIRDRERAGESWQQFIELARSVYQPNDDHAAIKRRINERLGSKSIE
jgi:hypothetical protein